MSPSRFIFVLENDKEKRVEQEGEVDCNGEKRNRKEKTASLQSLDGRVFVYWLDGKSKGQ